MAVSNFLSTVTPGAWGWSVVTLVLIYEIYAPKVLDTETALSPIIHDVPDKVDTLSEKQEKFRDDMDTVRSNVEEVQDRQKIQMQVQRAQARANPQMDEHQVDNYLLKNGVEPNEFLHGDEMTGYANWDTENDSEDNSDD